MHMGHSQNIVSNLSVDFSFMKGISNSLVKLGVGDILVDKILDYRPCDIAMLRGHKNIIFASVFKHGDLKTSDLTH